MELVRFFSFWALPLAALGLWLMARELEPNYPLERMVVWVFVGILTWSLLEYFIHRFIFHWQPSNRRLRRFIARLHLVHHGDAHNPDQILVTPQFSLPVSALILALLYALMGRWSGPVAILIGIWIGFLYYETVHYRVHLSKRSHGLLQLQRRNHFIHHFIDDRRCFGVTTPLWDVCFGTYRKLDR